MSEADWERNEALEPVSGVIGFGPGGTYHPVDPRSRVCQCAPVRNRAVAVKYIAGTCPVCGLTIGEPWIDQEEDRPAELELLWGELGKLCAWLRRRGRRRGPVLESEE